MRLRLAGCGKLSQAPPAEWWPVRKFRRIGLPTAVLSQALEHGPAEKDPSPMPCPGDLVERRAPNARCNGSRNPAATVSHFDLQHVGDTG